MCGHSTSFRGGGGHEKKPSGRLVGQEAYSPGRPCILWTAGSAEGLLATQMPGLAYALALACHGVRKQDLKLKKKKALPNSFSLYLKDRETKFALPNFPNSSGGPGSRSRSPMWRFHLFRVMMEPSAAAFQGVHYQETGSETAPGTQTSRPSVMGSWHPKQ